MQGGYHGRNGRSPIRATVLHLSQQELGVGAQDAPEPFAPRRNQCTAVCCKSTGQPEYLVTAGARRSSRPDVGEFSSAQVAVTADCGP
eukprot:12950597-Alexandrium_andersonii.AAC.1